MDNMILRYQGVDVAKGFSYKGKLKEVRGFERASDMFHLWERQGRLHLSLFKNSRHQYIGLFSTVWRGRRGVHKKETQKNEA
jgi:hypothetical protein